MLLSQVCGMISPVKGAINRQPIVVRLQHETTRQNRIGQRRIQDVLLGQTFPLPLDPLSPFPFPPFPLPSSPVPSYPFTSRPLLRPLIAARGSRECTSAFGAFRVENPTSCDIYGQDFSEI